MTMNTQHSKAAVLFVHGLQGSPAQFDFLVRSLPEGTAYCNLLLPGHGGKTRAFRRHGKKDWEASVRKAAYALGQEHDRVIFVGHSMGCLLGLRTVLREGPLFDAMLFIACPFRLRPTARFFKRNVQALSRRPTKDPAVLAARAAIGVHAAHPLALLTCPRPYLDLLRLIREIRKCKSKPHLRVTAAFPEKDEIVSPASFRIAQDDWRFAPLLLPDSGHVFFSDAAKEQLIQILHALLR